MKAQTEYRDDQGNVIGTSDSRMMVTIAETENRVELHVTMIGQIQANGFGLALLYQPSALTLTDDTFDEDVLPPNIAPNAITQNVVTLAPALMKFNSEFTWMAGIQQTLPNGMV